MENPSKEESKDNTVTTKLPKRFQDLQGFNLAPNEQQIKSITSLEVLIPQLRQKKMEIYMGLFKEGKSVINIIKNKKEYHNPDLLNVASDLSQDLITQFGIEEHGTNFDKRIINPMEALDLFKQTDLPKDRRAKPPPNSNIRERGGISSFTKAQMIKESLWSSGKR